MNLGLMWRMNILLYGSRLQGLGILRNYGVRFREDSIVNHIIITLIIKESNITFTIQNNYDTSTYSGSKGLYLSTSGVLGGKNAFLSISSLVVSFLSFIITAFFYC